MRSHVDGAGSAGGASLAVVLLLPRFVALLAAPLSA